MSYQSKSKGYIFIHNPRTAGTSLEQFLGGGGHKSIWEFDDRDKYFKFMFVRNPYDRFLSGLKHEHLGDHLEERLKFLMDKSLEKQRYMVYKPQVMFGTRKELDFIGRYENLKRDWNYIKDKLQIKGELPYLNKSSGKANLTDKAIEMINYLYKEDFNEFGYKKI